ncbi:MAG: energy-coupling factor transporter transmembrane component T [Desulfobacterales bacterium]|nr:energy-coupling factor transporter transmembrane component T [Desulfobacterales bacterium]
MAELTAVAFTSGQSLLHHLDPRVKLALVALLGLAAMQAAAPGLGLLSMALLSAGLCVRLPFVRVLGEMRYLMLLLALVWVVRGLVTPGDALITVAGVSLSRQGAIEGALICWRLLLIAAAGTLFVCSTRPAAIKAAAQWLLKPVPLVPEKRVAVMLSLVVGFIPVILNQTRETLDAQRARGIENRRNPAARLARLAIPVLRRIFADAEKLTLAMESRCYSEDRSDPALSAGRRDWLALAAGLSLWLLVLLA